MEDEIEEIIEEIQKRIDDFVGLKDKSGAVEELRWVKEKLEELV